MFKKGVIPLNYNITFRKINFFALIPLFEGKALFKLFKYWKTGNKKRHLLIRSIIKGTVNQKRNLDHSEIIEIQ